MPTIRPLDDNGWMVPRLGTKSRLVYNLMRVGLKATAMLAFMPEGTTVGTVKVLASKIRHPEWRPKDRPRYIEVNSPPSP